MKKLLYSVILGLFITVNCSADAQENYNLPGIQPSEAVLVTKVEQDENITVRKVSFLRSNNIVLVGNLFLPSGFDPNKNIQRLFPFIRPAA